MVIRLQFEPQLSYTNSENTDVQLFFDYSGLPKEDADPGTFYDNFQTTQFDEVLQYVEFPAVRLKDGKLPRGESFREHRGLYNAKTIGRKDLLFFFSWLKDKGVKHIIKVIVQDSTDWHCDEAIERCLSPFCIDVLDWSKPDLDPEMLCKACPDVKELHLRWGANNAILRAWGEPEGLRQLKLLDKICLYYDQVNRSSLFLDGYCKLIGPTDFRLYQRECREIQETDRHRIACLSVWRDNVTHGKERSTTAVKQGISRRYFHNIFGRQTNRSSGFSKFGSKPPPSHRINNIGVTRLK